MAQDRAAFAEVAVQGKANGLAFEVVRRRGSRVNDLTFHLDGKDMTRQVEAHISHVGWCVSVCVGALSVWNSMAVPLPLPHASCPFLSGGAGDAGGDGGDAWNQRRLPRHVGLLWAAPDERTPRGHRRALQGPRPYIPYTRCIYSLCVSCRLASRYGTFTSHALPFFPAPHAVLFDSVCGGVGASGPGGGGGAVGRADRPRQGPGQITRHHRRPTPIPGRPIKSSSPSRHAQARATFRGFHAFCVPSPFGQAALTQRDLDGKAADRAALQASLATAKADLSQATKAGPTVDISRLEGELEAAMQRMETARVAWEAQVRESRQGSQAIQQAKARVSLLQSRVKDKEAKLHKAVVRLFGKDTGGQWDVRAMEAEKAKIDDEVRLSFQA